MLPVRSTEEGDVMGMIYNYLITTSCEDADGDAIARLNERLAPHADCPDAFLPLHPHAGGGPAMEASVYGFATKVLSPEDVADAMRETQWEDLETVRLYVQGPEDETFSAVEWSP